MQDIPRRLTRSRHDKMIAGVASGIGRYFSIDPVIVRLIFAVLFFSGPAALIYPILWIIMPLEPEQPGFMPSGGAPAEGQTQRISWPVASGEQEVPISQAEPQAATPGSRNRALGIGLLVVGGFLTLNTILPAIAPFVIPLALIGAGFYLLRRP